MTFIQPHQNKNIINVVLVILILALFSGSILLIRFYNSSVNLEHNVSNLDAQIKDLETRNSEFQNKIFVLFDEKNLEELAQKRRLIKDNNPQYLKIGQNNSSQNIALTQ